MAVQARIAWNSIINTIPKSLENEFYPRLTSMNPQQARAAHLELWLCSKLNAAPYVARIINGQGMPDIELNSPPSDNFVIEIKTRWESTEDTKRDSRTDQLFRDTYPHLKDKSRVLDVLSITLGDGSPSPKKLAAWIDQQPLSNITSFKQGAGQTWQDAKSGWSITTRVISIPLSPGNTRSTCRLADEIRSMMIPNALLEELWKRIRRQHPTYKSTLVPAVMWADFMTAPDKDDFEQFFSSDNPPSSMIWIPAFHLGNPPFQDPILLVKDKNCKLVQNWPYSLEFY